MATEAFKCVVHVKESSPQEFKLLFANEALIDWQGSDKIALQDWDGYFSAIVIHICQAILDEIPVIRLRDNLWDLAKEGVQLKQNLKTFSQSKALYSSCLVRILEIWDAVAWFAYLVRGKEGSWKIWVWIETAVKMQWVTLVGLSLVKFCQLLQIDTAELY